MNSYKNVKIKREKKDKVFYTSAEIFFRIPLELLEIDINKINLLYI